MCTLIVGLGTLAGAAVIGANRDEDPARPSDPPGLLRDTPRVVGGRDRLAGGTWLAVRESRAMVAMLNRRPAANAARAAFALRSRGLLAIDVAAAVAAPGATLADAARDRARQALAADRYAPFTLVFASADHAWLLAHDETGDHLRNLDPGWHVVTHADLDDRAEPRTARLLDGLAGWRPASADEAERGLVARLALHAGTEPAEAAVCIHDGRMVTVSFAVVVLGPSGARYGHGEGRPCTAPLCACDELLSGVRR